MTHLLILILLFITYLVPQAMIMNGIFLAASGNTELRPDGTYHNSEMILYPLAKYFNQKTMIKVYYPGGLLSDLLTDISNRFPTIPASSYWRTEDERLLWLKQKHLIENSFEIKIEVTQENKILFYKEYSNYKFSKYIRKPLFGCIICMPSFWGIFTFLIPALFAFHFDLIVLALYIPNTFCLSFLNYKIMKPI